MGRRQTMQASFANHQIGHLQNMLLHGFPIDISRLPESVRVHLKQTITKMNAALSGTAES
jgi:enoyl-CoA hydratase